jgi:hypothetical protein
MEDAALRTVARLDGTPFPSTAQLASRWLLGRVPAGRRGGGARLETAYCAQVLAVTYQAMGLLPSARRPGRYDPGSFWSGDNLELSAGFRLGREIAVHLPAGDTAVPRPPAESGSITGASTPVARAIGKLTGRAFNRKPGISPAIGEFFRIEEFIRDYRP